MCIGKPNISEVLAGFESEGIEQLIVLPLYPQYSRTTTESGFDAVRAYYRDKDHVLLAARIDRDRSGLGLACREPNLGRFDAVVDRVAQDVDQRVAQMVENRAVEFDFGIANHDIDALARAASDFPRHPGQRPDDPLERRRAQLQRAALEFPHRARHAIEPD